VIHWLLYLLTGVAGIHILGASLYLFSPLPILFTLTSVLAVLEQLFTTVILLRLALVTSVIRLAWRLCSISFVFFAIGGSLAVTRLLQGKAMTPSWGDPFFITAGILFILGMLRLPRPDTLRLKGLRLFMDVAVPVMLFTLYTWRFAFAPQVLAREASALTIVIQTIYLLLDFSTISVVLVLLFWVRFSRQLVVLTVGTGLFVTGNLLFTLLAPDAGKLNVTPWVAPILALGHAVFCWGAYLCAKKPFSLEVIDPTSQYVRIINRSPYLGILACYALVLAPPPKEALVGIGVIVGVIVVTLIVLARQLLQITDNEMLTRDLQLLSSSLEQRVLERGKALEDSQSRLVASEKLASLGRLTAGLAHEINTPLAAAMHSLYQARELSKEYKSSLDAPSVTKEDHKDIANDLEETLSSAQTSLERLGEFVRRMREQTRVSSNVATFYPNQTIRDVIAVLQPRAKELNVTLGFFEPGDILTLHGDATRFSQVVSNLLLNALDACEGKGDGFVSVRLLAEDLLGENNGVRLEVHDNGVGIPETLQQKIFEPMFTTKEVGEGTGLGLTVVYDIVHGGFGGDISVSSSPVQGTTFTVRLPVQAKHVGTA
jgi:signal transduction histidine kinase